uniref:Uncharacterized protein n=1 Tax=Planktothrix agardhii TaxID=1160 RepID=A0A1J1JH30_PLAAG|nr:protein of unknown function [Planktothrix agardhii]
MSRRTSLSPSPSANPVGCERRLLIGKVFTIALTGILSTSDSVINTQSLRVEYENQTHLQRCVRVMEMASFFGLLIFGNHRYYI